MDSESCLALFQLYDKSVCMADIVREDECGWVIQNIRGKNYAIIDEMHLARDAVEVYFKCLKGGIYGRENDSSSPT